MPPEEFHDLLGVTACSLQSGDAVQKFSWCDTPKRAGPNFVRLPYTEECLSMDGTEIPFGSFGCLAAYGTIHDDSVLLDHPVYFHAFIPEGLKSELCLRVRGLRPR